MKVFVVLQFIEICHYVCGRLLKICLVLFFPIWFRIELGPGLHFHICRAKTLVKNTRWMDSGGVEPTSVLNPEWFVPDQATTEFRIQIKEQIIPDQGKSSRSKRIRLHNAVEYTLGGFCWPHPPRYIGRYLRWCAPPPSPATPPPRPREQPSSSWTPSPSRRRSGSSSRDGSRLPPCPSPRVDPGPRPNPRSRRAGRTVSRYENTCYVLQLQSLTAVVTPIRFRRIWIQLNAFINRIQITAW